MRPRDLLVLLVMAWLVTSPTRADAPVISWRAPTGCPDEAAARVMIARAAGAEPLSGAVQVQAEIIAVEAGYRMDLHIERAEQATDKRLFAERCATFAELIGLELALSHVVQPPAAPEPQALEPEPAPPSELRFGARLFGGTGTGPVPAWAARAGAAGSLGLRALRIELAAAYDFPRSTHYEQVADVGARFDAVTGQVRGCYAPRLGRIELPLCAGVEAGVIRGKGLGLEQTSSASRGFTALGLAPALRFPARGMISGWLELGAFFALQRPSFGIRNLPTLYRPDAVAFRAAGGVQLQFD